MNYYEFHIGDFNAATRHLTRVERSIYRDMIDMYYDTEKPLPLDLKILNRKLIARSEEEQEAVLVVLDEFFIKTESGYFHSRCDEVIQKYHSNTTAKSEAGKASAAKKEQARLERLAQLNGISTDVQQNSTAVKQPLDSVSTDVQQNSTNHKPITNNHKPINTSSSTREEIFLDPPDTRKKFKMFFDWEPSPNFLTDRKGYGFDAGLLTKPVLSEFVGYWSSKNEILTQGEWEHKFATNLVKLTKTPQVAGTVRKSTIPDNNTDDWMSPELLAMLEVQREHAN